MSNRVWVTLATNDSYGLGALVLAHSLRRASSAYPAVVLITPSVSEAMRDRLRAVFADVVTVDVLDSRDAAHLALLQRPELGITFTKIHCWNLTQYEKCVFLDADTLVIQNCDELFDREELSAAPDVGWPDCFNSGVFVFRPSADTFNELIKFAQERGSFDGGDQGLLNAFFSKWAHDDINKHLPFLYNVTSAAFYSYLPALKHYGQNIKIIHFIGAVKPWLQQFNWDSRTVNAPDHLRELLQLWWDLFVSQVHTQLDVSMVEVQDAQPDEPGGPPQDLSDYFHYLPVVDPESEFPWHHPGAQMQDEASEPKIDTSDIHNPWEIYRGHIPPRKEDTSILHSEIGGGVDYEAIRNHAWEYQAQVATLAPHVQDTHKQSDQYEHGQHESYEQPYHNEPYEYYEHHQHHSQHEYHHYQHDHDHHNDQFHHNHDKHHHNHDQHHHDQYHHNQNHNDQHHHEYHQQHQDQEQYHHHYEQPQYHHDQHEQDHRHYEHKEHHCQPDQVHTYHHDEQSHRPHEQPHVRHENWHRDQTQDHVYNYNEHNQNTQNGHIEKHTQYPHDLICQHSSHMKLLNQTHILSDTHHETHTVIDTHAHKDHERESQVVGVHQVHSDKVSKSDRGIDPLKNKTKEMNGDLSDTDSEFQEVVRPRHPYDGFYLRHRMTIDSHGRKICSHEIPILPSSPPESPLPEDELDMATEEILPTSDNEDHSGVAGNLARVVAGGAQREAVDELTRRQGWEAGNIDYMGADSFDNIWAKITQTLSQPRTSPPRQPQPEAPVETQETKQPEAIPAPVEASEASAPAETAVTAPAPVPAATTVPAEVPAPVAVQADAPVPSEIPVPVEVVVPVDTAVPVKTPVKVDAPSATAPIPEKTVAVPAGTPAVAPAPTAADVTKTTEAQVPVVTPVETPVPTPIPVVAPTEIPKTVEAVEAAAIKEAAKGSKEKTESAPVKSVTEVVEVPKVAPPAESPAKAALPAAPTVKTSDSPPAVASPAKASDSSPSGPSPVKVPASPPVAAASAKVSANPTTAAAPAKASDSPPLANTPSKEAAPPLPAAKSEERRKPAGKLQLRPPVAADPLPTPDSELEDAASLASSIIAGELRTPTVTAPASASPPALHPTALQEKRLSVEEPEVPTPPIGAVSLAQIGVKPAAKGKASTAAQIESSVTEGTEAPRKKLVKKVVKKVVAPGDAPVPPPRKKEKKPKEQ